MAPRKEKVEKTSGDQAADLIFDYLRKQNRPYSATDISANLHNRVTKAAATKHLKDMHDRKEVEGRVSGKQIVYHAIQDSAELSKSPDLADIISSFTSVQSETSDLLAQFKTLKSQLSVLDSTPSLQDINSSIISLEMERNDISERLGPLKSGSVKKVDNTESVALISEIQTLDGIHARRKRIVHDLWEIARDSLPEGKRESDLKEELGLED